MNANIVLAGGAAKGAVLGGCLLAAESARIEAVGFGGTSAGSIVATLASVGYNGAELKQILLKTDLASLLDDRGVELEELKIAWKKFKGQLAKRSWLTSVAMWSLASFFKDSLGLYEGSRLKPFLANAIEAKLGSTGKPANELTFDDLAARGCRPLRVVATDIFRRRAVVFGTGTLGGAQCVVDAVMASASFPFVFKPVALADSLLVDGGLSSNLPAFLFEKEYRESRTPTLAFDLVSPEELESSKIGTPDMGEYVQAMLSSSLEASDVLLREATPGVQYFPIRTPLKIDTLDFKLTQAQREACFEKGFAEATQLLADYEPIRRARQFGQNLQVRMIAQFGPIRLYQPVLRALVEQLQTIAGATIQNPRAHIMLLTGKATDRAPSTRIVTYSIGMEKDGDIDLELDQDGGCSGLAWETGEVAVADLVTARQNPIPWKMTIEQHNKVPERIKSMISVPIPGNIRAETAPERPVGTLSVDCETLLVDSEWCTDEHNLDGVGPEQQPKVKADVATLMRAWATVIGAMLP